jgi:hypothetical protein
MSETSRERTPVESWIPAALAQLGTELLRFGRTLAAFLVRPAQSAASWAAGTLTPMNPLGFVATAAGVYWAVVNGLAAVWPVAGPPAGVGDQISSTIGPQVHYGLLGVTLHVVLRVLGSRRPLAGSIGVSFYVGGSVGLLVATFMSGVTQYFAHSRGTATLFLASGDVVPLSLLAAAVVSYGVVLLALSRAMHGMQSMPIWKALTAVAAAVVITALLFGSILPEGTYGWHPYLAASLRSGSLAFGFRS